MRFLLLCIIFFGLTFHLNAQSVYDVEYHIDGEKVNLVTISGAPGDKVSGVLYTQEFPFNVGVFEFFYTDFNNSGNALKLSGSNSTIQSDYRYSSFPVGCTTVAISELIRFHEPTPLTLNGTSSVYTYNIKFREYYDYPAHQESDHAYPVSGNITIEYSNFKRDYDWSSCPKKAIKDETTSSRYVITRSGTYAYNDEWFGFANENLNSYFQRLPNNNGNSIEQLIKEVGFACKAEFIGSAPTNNPQTPVTYPNQFNALDIYAFHNDKWLYFDASNEDDYPAALINIKKSILAGLPVYAMADSDVVLYPGSNSFNDSDHAILIYGWDEGEDLESTSDDVFWSSTGWGWKKDVSKNALYWVFPYIQPHHYRYVSNNEADWPINPIHNGWVLDPCTSINSALNNSFTISDITEALPEGGVIYLKGNNDSGGNYSNEYPLTGITNNSLVPITGGSGDGSYTIKCYNGEVFIKPAP